MVKIQLTTDDDLVWAMSLNDGEFTCQFSHDAMLGLTTQMVTSALYGCPCEMVLDVEDE